MSEIKHCDKCMHSLYVDMVDLREYCNAGRCMLSYLSGSSDCVCYKKRQHVFSQCYVKECGMYFLFADGIAIAYTDGIRHHTVNEHKRGEDIEIAIKGFFYMH